jgi:hypothetical protein
MGSAVSKSNKDFINNNWDQLKCSPIGPFLQMTGIAPGDANSTSNMCKSAEFSSQFNSSMTEHINISSQLTGHLSIIQKTLNKFRGVIASMEQQAFEDLSVIATHIFTIYVKIGNIMYVIIKNLISIMGVFNQSVNFAASVAKLLITFINLLSIPVNGVIDFVDFFKRGSLGKIKIGKLKL